MGRTSDARERLIEAVIELIWTGSYGSTSVDHICDRAGVKTGSFYHFFKSKTELALTGIDHGWSEKKKKLDQIFSPTTPPLQRLINSFQQCREEQEELKAKHGHVLGCPVHSLGAEISTIDDQLRSKLQQIIGQLILYYESAIRDAHQAGMIVAPNAPILARIVFTYCEGLLLHARIGNDLSHLDELETGALLILGVKDDVNGEGRSNRVQSPIIQGTIADHSH